MRGSLDGLCRAPNQPLPIPDRYCRVRDGFLYAGARLRSAVTVRPSGVLLISACGRPFTLRVGGRSVALQAAAVRPQVARGLDAVDVQLVSLNMHPSHGDYLAWLPIAGACGEGVQPLPREAFAAHDEALRAFCAGALDQPAGQALFNALLATLWPQLPAPAPAHALRPALLAWLAQHPDTTLGELAAGLGLSYHRMSHLFTQAVGLPFRQWCAFARTQRAAQQFKAPLTLTGIAHEAGYADSAHLSRTWQRAYGLSPSFVRHDNSVQAIV